YTVNHMPVHRGTDLLPVYPFPSFGMPVAEVSVTSRVNELDKLSIGNEGATNAILLQINLVPPQFIVKAEPFSGMADLIDTFFHFQVIPLVVIDDVDLVHLQPVRRE